MRFVSVFCSLFVLLACWGCGHIEERLLDRYDSLGSYDYLMIAPPGRANLECVTEFIAFKKEQGFHLKVLEFGIEQPRPDRLAQVSQLLRQHRPADGDTAYVLIVASDSELPMPNWQMQGTDTYIRSDLPLYLAAERDQDEEPHGDDWKKVLAPDFPWIFGRLPFENDETLATSIRSTVAFATQRPATPFALLGAERWVLPADASLILSQAKQRFIQNGWQAELYATDLPNDVTIDSEGANGASSADLQFIGRWSRGHPQVAYTITHSGRMLGDYGGKLVHGQGRYLISAAAFEVIQGRHGEYRPPTSPAIFVTTGCSTGSPDNGLIDILFANGWIAGFIGSTTVNGPLPFLPAIGAEINIAQCLGRGMPLGLAVRATEKTYYDQSYGPLTCLMDEKTREMIASNIISYVIYGDPSLTCTAPEQTR